MSDTQDIAWEREKQRILDSARAGFGHVEGISDIECLLRALAASRRAYEDRVRERNEYRERAAKAEAALRPFAAFLPACDVVEGQMRLHPEVITLQLTLLAVSEFGDRRVWFLTRGDFERAAAALRKEGDE